MSKFKIDCPNCGEEITIKNEKVLTGDDATNLILWEDKFNLGVPEMDEQHQGFVTIVNKMYTAMKAETREEGFLQDCINELNTYFKNHFAAEEQLFSSSEYPKVKLHKEKHQRFIAYIEILNVELESTIFNIQPALKFLVQWFIKHIQGVDREYAPYVQKAAS